MTAAHDLAQDPAVVEGMVRGFLQRLGVESPIQGAREFMEVMRVHNCTVVRSSALDAPACPPAPDTAASGDDVGVGGAVRRLGAASVPHGPTEAACRWCRGTGRIWLPYEKMSVRCDTCMG